MNEVRHAEKPLDTVAVADLVRGNDTEGYRGVIVTSIASLGSG
jgi:hypothetical protein